MTQPDGTIDLIEYGQLVVTGMSLDEIRDAVEQKIAAKERKKDCINLPMNLIRLNRLLISKWLEIIIYRYKII